MLISITYVTLLKHCCKRNRRGGGERRDWRETSCVCLKPNRMLERLLWWAPAKFLTRAKQVLLLRLSTVVANFLKEKPRVETPATDERRSRIEREQEQKSACEGDSCYAKCIDCV